VSVVERLDPFTLAGIAAVETAAVGQLLLRVAIEPVYTAMYRDFGGTLPVLTRLFIEPWGAAAIVTALSVGGMSTLLIPPRSVRLGAIGALLLFGAMATGAFWVAMYLPIWETAQALKD